MHEFGKTPFQGFVQAVPEERSSRLLARFRVREAALSPFVLKMRTFCGITSTSTRCFRTKTTCGLTDTPSFDAGASYSASGKEIAFNSDRSGSFEIWKMKQNGTQEEQVTGAAARRARHGLTAVPVTVTASHSDRFRRCALSCAPA